ncbi:hypothetical protein O3794_02695 [Gemella sanguinis]|uniref:hypothetical protein n=1 Tax=Gemella sanguinis TaxID=84135 RepID=UPI00352D2034
MKLENLTAVQTILNEINNNKLIIENINYDFYIHVDLITREFKEGGVYVPDTMKNSIVRMFEKRNEYLVDELQTLGVELW